jgi:hypothetical protein
MNHGTQAAVMQSSDAPANRRMAREYVTSLFTVSHKKSSGNDDANQDVPVMPMSAVNGDMAPIASS